MEKDTIRKNLNFGGEKSEMHRKNGREHPGETTKAASGAWPGQGDGENFRGAGVWLNQEMGVSQTDPPQSGLLGRPLGFEGEIPGSDGQIVEVELRGKTQEAIGNVGVEDRDEAGQAVNLLQIHVARHQQGAGAQQRHFRALGEKGRQPRQSSSGSGGWRPR